MIKTAVIVGGAYAAGKMGGSFLVDRVMPGAGATATTAVQIGTGILAFFVLSSVLR